MLTIIEINGDALGFHRVESQNSDECWLEGYVPVPEELEELVWDCAGWCDLTIEDGVLTAVTPITPPEVSAPLVPSNQELMDAILELSQLVGGEA